MKELGFKVGGQSGFGENARITASVSLDRAKPSVEQKHLEGPLVDKIRGGFSNDQQILLAQLIETADLEVSQLENIPADETENAYDLLQRLINLAESNGGKLEKADTAKLYAGIVQGIYD